MKTYKLTGQALDYAVAKSSDFDYDVSWNPSTNWSLGGPIIERERIRIDCPWSDGPFEATCKIDGVTSWVTGPTILIAAMRCYVASRLGGSVDIPKELK